ncbi:MAG: GNAT family N-acetyltransferase [Chloroflexota bacterium]
MAASELDGLRAYQPQDLDRVLQFVGECCAASDFCGCLHYGDVIHFMSNTLRGRDLSNHLHIYEADGAIQAIILLNPARIAGFNVIAHPDLRGTALEYALLAWADISERMLAPEAQSIVTEGADCDTNRQKMLRDLGYEASAKPDMMVTMRSLQTIPGVVLPDGFTIRPVAGEHEAAWVIEAHVSAFNSKWTAEDYLSVMRTPGFEIDRELVVVAPDGRCAAFLVYWLDPVTRCGLFEPVGCHADFQRRGLTRALMYEGMRRMKSRGMTSASVAHHTDNLASTGLYRSLGFTPKYSVTDFSKAMAS